MKTNDDDTSISTYRDSTENQQDSFATPPAIELPTGGGAIRGIDEKFRVNPATGSGAMAVPIFTSPSRNNFGPQLSLNYDSAAGNGPFGLGWSLSIPKITRKTSKGLPQYRDSQNSDTFILSEAEDLVPLLEQDGDNWERHVLDQSLDGIDYRIERYRPRIEGSFSRIERWTRLNTGEGHWRSITRDNITSLYGLTYESRIADPNDPQRIFSWHLCESYDDKGNAILYQYTAEDSANVELTNVHERNRSFVSRASNRYLKRIKYGNRTPREPNERLADRDDWMFEVVFDYGEGHLTKLPLDSDGRQFVQASLNEVQAWPARSDAFSDYRAGFEVRTYRLCRQVLMFHHFEAELGLADYLVKTTELSYDEGPILTYLTSAAQSGYVRQEATDQFLCHSLPPIDFTYSRVPLQDGLQPDDAATLQVREISAIDAENLPIGLGSPFQFVDLDGEGISGILTEQSDTWYYKPNLGNGSFGALQEVAKKPSMAELNSGQQQLLDLAGDRQLDLALLEPGMSGFYERSQDHDWRQFRPFSHWPNVDFGDPNLRFIDLTGDGLADLLTTEDDVITWYPSLAEAGFAEGEWVRQPWDEETGPRLVLSDGTQSIFLSDMSGDGLSDLVRIRNGEMCYWPNLGYGRFGTKVSMDHAPWFEALDLFDGSRIRLADIDGSGITDIIYLGQDGIQFYYNQAGNSWSDADTLPHFPGIDNLVQVQVADFLGNGTTCLVWSSPLASDAGSQLRYVDLMNGTKPHLLTHTTNHLGSESVVHYAPSTKFYLADQAAGTPWVTRQPFPVHVVERLETFDHISRNRFVSRYSYHHGYFDGEEREFRGFGRVDQLDTEEFATLSQSESFPDSENIDTASHIPPVLTKSWFHTGAYVEGARISLTYIDEYYREPGLSDEGFDAQLLADTVLPDEVLSIAAEKEAVRALKGSMLHQEVYAIDDGQQAEHPYLVTEQNFSLKLVQPEGENPHAVFYTHSRETISHHYERNPADPRITQSAILETDSFGNVLHDVSIGYGRRQPDPELAPGDQDRQAQSLFTTTENTYTNAIDQEPTNAREAAYRTPLLAETRQYELTGLPEPANGVRYSFDELDSATRNAAALPYHEIPTPSIQEKRLIQQSLTLYRPDDLGMSEDDALKLLSPGVLEPLALHGETYQLAMTLDHLNLVFGSRADDAVRIEGGYVLVDGGGWWIPSGRVFLSPDTTDSAANELAHADQNFYLQKRYRDPFGHSTQIEYDDHRLLSVRSTDPLNNRVQVRNDYRLLQPAELTDPNGNRSEVAFDTIGLVAGNAVMGKQGEDLGDSLAGFASALTQAQIDAFMADPRGPVALELLGNATRRFIYDEARFARLGADHPPFAATIVRETHVNDLSDGEQAAIQVSIAYSDGFSRVIQTKVQAEPGPIDGVGPDADPRWVGSGWTVFNNKGGPVRQYEPFFDDTHAFRFGHEVGVSPTMFYDPVGRLVATLHPNHSWEKVIFDPWHEESWDVNDTVLLDPAADTDVGAFFRRLPNGAYLPTWYQERINGVLGAEEQAAAANTAAHANTSSIAHLDALKRTILSVVDNGNGETYATRTAHDIKGKPLTLTDALDRVAMEYVLRISGQQIPGYDMLENPLLQHHMDAGERRTLMNVSGNPLRRWDARDQTLRSVYDALQRITELFVADINGERLVQRTVYGEAQGSSENHHGQVFQQFDGAGVVTFEAYDFKHNLLRSVRQYTNAYNAVPDWSTDPPLNGDRFTNQTEYDALNRPNTVTLPDGSLIQTRYNNAILLESVEANLRAAGTATVFVSNVDYDAKGQRERIEYGNGVVTEYAYDAFSFRLIRLHTTRGSNSLQDLHYVYDPAGNITAIRDDAQQTNYFNNAVVAPRADYVYDALYRLATAAGREHIGQVAQPQASWNDEFRAQLQHPHDGAAMRNYTERYTYDGVGNILNLVHEATNGNWSRGFAYNEESPFNSAAVNNRLSQTTVNGSTETFTYDDHGNMRSMPHLMQMDWDYADRLHLIDRGGGGTAFYQYDSSGQRVRKVIENQNGVRLSERLYVGGFERYREFNGSGSDTTLERESVHILDDKRRIVLVETRTQGDDGSPFQLIRYQFDNHLGSASLELSDTGEVISYEEYYPFGSTAYQAVRSQTDGLKRYRYTGMERDEESGLNYHHARFYAVWLGRWISTDPSGMVDGPNLYRYSRNNPIRLTDVLGTDPDEYNIGPLQLQNPQLTPTGSAHVNLQLNNLFGDNPTVTVNSAELEGELRLNSDARLPAFDLNGTATGRLQLGAAYRDQELSASLAGRATFDVGPLELQTRFGADGTTQVPSTIPLRLDAVEHLQSTALQNLQGRAYANARLNLGRYTLGTASLRSEIGAGGEGSIDASARLILPDPSGSGGLTIGRLSGTGTISPEGYNISGDYYAVTPVGGGFGDFSLSSDRGFETTAHYFGLQFGPLALSPDMADLAEQFATAGGADDPYATTQVFDPGTSIGYSLINYSESGLNVFSVGFSPRASLLNYSQAQPPLPSPAGSLLESALYGQETSQPAGYYFGASLRGNF